MTRNILQRPIGAARWVSTAAVTIAAACGQGSIASVSQSPPPPPPPAGSLSVAKFGGDLQSGAQGTQVPVPLEVHVTEPSGEGAPGVVVTWTATSNGAVSNADAITNQLGVANAVWRLRRTTTDPLTVADTVIVAAAGAGTVTFTAQALPVPVALVTIAGVPAVMLPGATAQATASAFDAIGIVLTHRAVNWTTDSAFFATVASNGLVTAVGADSTKAGNVHIHAIAEGVVGSAAVTIPFPMVVTPSSVPFISMADPSTGGAPTSAQLVVTGVPAPTFSAGSLIPASITPDLYNLSAAEFYWLDSTSAVNVSTGGVVTGKYGFPVLGFTSFVRARSNRYHVDAPLNSVLSTSSINQDLWVSPANFAPASLPQGRLVMLVRDTWVNGLPTSISGEGRFVTSGGQPYIATISGAWNTSVPNNFSFQLSIQVTGPSGPVSFNLTSGKVTGSINCGGTPNPWLLTGTVQGFSTTFTGVYKHATLQNC